MAPNNKDKGDKGNRPNKGGKNKVAPSVIPTVVPQKPVTPILQFPTHISFPPTLIPAVQTKKWCFANNISVLTSNEPTALFTLNQGNVVSVKRQGVRVPGHDASWSEIEYQGRVGWVNEVFLDDYVEEFPPNEVEIPNPTESTNDAQQYMVLDGDVKFNMCGELCVAYVVRNDIETVLKTWKDFPAKGPFSYSESTINEGTTPHHLKDILRAYGYTGPGDIEDLDAGVKEHSLDVDCMQEMLKTHYLVARVKSNINEKAKPNVRHTGELLAIDQGSGMDERNHWVVVNAITHQGNRVEIYNPFQNQRETYTFNDFFYSCTATKLSGLWVTRKNSPAPQISEELMENRVPRLPVQLESPPAEAKAEQDFKAKQYILVDGGKKTELCGEFCAAYILTNSIDNVLEHWRKKESAEMSELVTFLRVYGYYPKDQQSNKAFSIRTVLNYWKEVQPKLHEYHVGDNKPTGSRELKTIFKAYGYNNDGDLMGFRTGLTDPATGQYLPSPGRMKKMLETHFLIAGIGIDGLTGRLKRGQSAVRHWEVVEEIHPAGKHYIDQHFGGSGGWATLYNPFTNVLEEYSYKEFTDAMSEQGFWDGLWVKRDVDPKFMEQEVLFPDLEKDGEKDGRRPKKNDVVVKWPEKKLIAEIEKKLKNGKPADTLAPILVRMGSGWSLAEITAHLPKSGNADAESADSFKALLCQRLNVTSMPAEVVELVRQQSDGDPYLAGQLASALFEAGVLLIGENQECTLRSFPGTPDLRQAAISSFIDSVSLSQQKAPTVGGELTLKIANAIRPIIASRAIEEVRKVQVKDNLLDASGERISAQIKDKEQTAIPAKPVPAELLYRVRKWGDPVMSKLKLDWKVVGSNFQAVGLYNKETGFGAVANFIYILREDIDNLRDMQFDEVVNGEKITKDDKMNWLCAHRGRIYMYDKPSDNWRTAAKIRWGTLALGGNLVQVAGSETIKKVKLPGLPPGAKKEDYKMWRLAGFRKTDWSRPLDELLAAGLVHRCYCAGKNNRVDDSPKGIVYSPIYSLADWDFTGVKKPSALYIPDLYLEPKAT